MCKSGMSGMSGKSGKSVNSVNSVEFIGFQIPKSDNQQLASTKETPYAETTRLRLLGPLVSSIHTIPKLLRRRC